MNDSKEVESVYRTKRARGWKGKGVGLWVVEWKMKKTVSSDFFSDGEWLRAGNSSYL